MYIFICLLLSALLSWTFKVWFCLYVQTFNQKVFYTTVFKANIISVLSKRTSYIKRKKKIKHSCRQCYCPPTQNFFLGPPMSRQDKCGALCFFVRFFAANLDHIYNRKDLCVGREMWWSPMDRNDQSTGNGIINGSFISLSTAFSDMEDCLESFYDLFTKRV